MYICMYIYMYVYIYVCFYALSRIRLFLITLMPVNYVDACKLFYEEIIIIIYTNINLHVHVHAYLCIFMHFGPKGPRDSGFRQKPI